jgi:hypothetical protein
MAEYYYRGTPLSAYSLWDLGLVDQTLINAEIRREEAKKHPRFTKLNIQLPPPNVEFLKLKDAIEAEIERRQKVNTNDTKTG